MPEKPEPVYTGQGTRTQEVAPWMTYDSEMKETFSKELEQEIAEYSKHRYDPAQSSTESKEELCRQKEINQEMVKDYQWVKPEEYEYIGPRIGTVMHSSTFLNKLRKDCHLDCWYVVHPHPDKATLIVNTPSGPQVAGWVQLGFMVEFEIMRFDDKGVPLDSRRRGWRTAALQLILKGMLSEEISNKIFGPAVGPASERYNSTLYSFRNRGGAAWRQ